MQSAVAEVNVNTLCALERPAVSLNSMAEQTIGAAGARLSSAAFLLLHYCLLTAYILQGGELLLDAAGGLLSAPPPTALGAPVFAGTLMAALVRLSPPAIERANSLPFAFQNSVFTQNIDTALRCYNRFHAATVMVNDHTAFRVDWMPFAGAKASGLGIGGIPYTLRDMQVEKQLVLRSDGL